MASRSLGTPFWRLFVSLSGSNLADGIGRTALPLLATTLTRDPLAISGLVTLAFLPWLLFAPPGGVLVDRVDRRRAMAVTHVFRAVVVGGLGVAVLLDRADIAALYVVAFLLGAAETVYDSAARAVLPGIVRRDQLDRANSFLVTVEMVGERFLGAPVGALLFAVAAAAPFLINSGGFVLAALLIVGIRPRRGEPSHRPPAREPSTLQADLRVGVTWLRTQHAARDLMLLTVAIVAAGAMADAVLVLYVLDPAEVARQPAGQPAPEQALIPNDIFGRVQGAWRTLVWGVIPVGSLLGGVLASVTDVPTVFLVSGALQVLAAASWAVLRRHRAEIAASFVDAAPSSASVPS